MFAGVQSICSGVWGSVTACAGASEHPDKHAYRSTGIRTHDPMLYMPMSYHQANVHIIIIQCFNIQFIDQTDIGRKQTFVILLFI